MRKSIARLEQIVLRYLNFDLKVSCPHNQAYVISATLRDYFPTELASTTNKFPTILGTLLQDASLTPDFIINRNPLTAAIILVSLAMQLSNLSIEDRQWVPVFSKELSLERLQKLKRRFLRTVYDEDL